MLTSALFPLLTMASMVQGLPLDNLDSPVLAARQTGAVASAQKWDPQTGLPIPPTVAPPAVVSPAAVAPAVATPSNPMSGDEGTSGGTSSSGGAGSSAYKMYSGDGKSWPSQNEWIGDFETMFNNNKPTMKISCDWLQKTNPTDQEISDIKSGIIAASKDTGVDKRFILAIMMQESGGCVRVHSTDSGQVRNPGLMQCHDGQYECTTTPCTTKVIHGMISEGSTGTAKGDGLKQVITKAKNQGATGAQAFYWAARIYNTGSYTAGADLAKVQYGTACYSSDIANRLTGWASKDKSPCDKKADARG